jgi:ElaB/YqjD/DUF883 family membrane-anchored ribosome-binding protein
MPSDLHAEPAAVPSPKSPPADARQGLLERFEDWLPAIQQRWPEVARSALEASRGSFDELAETIASHSGRTAAVVKEQLLELVETAGSQTERLAEQLEPLEAQLESLLDELNASQRPLMAIGIAAGVGVLLGLLLAAGRRSR